MSRIAPAALLLAVAAVSSSAFGQLNGVNSATRILDTATAVDTATQLGAIGYKPATDTTPDVLYTISTGNGTSIRRITNVDNPALRVAETAITLTPWQNWQQDTINNITGTSGGQPVSQGLALNPIAVGSAQPFTLGVVTDQAGVVRVNAVNRYDLTKRVYAYNLGIGSPSPSDQYAGYGLFSSKLTASAQYTAAGVPSGSTPSIQISQPAFSSDGQSVYFADSSAGLVGGIWRTDVVNGTSRQLLADGTRSKTDIGIKSLGGGVDRLYLSGSTNFGGADSLVSVDVPNTATTIAAPSVLVTQAALRTFLGVPASSTSAYTVNGIVADGTDVFFDVSGGSASGSVTDPLQQTRRSALLRLDAQGRLSKVISYAERRAAFGGGNTLSEKHIVRTSTYSDGVNAPRAARQIMFIDRTLAQVEGAWVFDVGDFNFDGTVDDADMALLRTPGVLQPLGSALTTDVAKFKFDLNAAAFADTRTTGGTAPAVSVDYYDVKVLQQFYPFADGDADFSRAVDFADLLVVAQNYGGTGKVWTQGEFTGDASGTVDFADLLVLAQHYGQSTLAAQSTLASLTVGGPISAQFAADWALAQSLVPEPATCGLATAGLALVATRRRRYGL